MSDDMKKPFKHQVAMTAHILKEPYSLITSDPGTGKTRSVLDALNYLKENAEKRPRTLVLAPLSILQASWGNDIEEFTPNLSYSVAYAKNRIVSEGLSEQINLLSKDYRSLEGTYEKVVSVEMIEAVGRKYLSGYFSKLNDLLKPSGLLMLQAITIADQRYKSYRNGEDFIQKHIFPGGFLPSLFLISKIITNSTELILRDVKDIGLDYAKTLSHWHENLIDKKISPRYEEISIQEALIDDQTSEEIANFLEIFRKKGAYDVSCQTINMKKNRTGFSIQVILPIEKQKYFRELWFQYSNTIGCLLYTSDAADE